MKQFHLFTQLPKPKDLGVGVLSVDRNGDAHFFSGQGEREARVLADMKRTRIEWAARDGIFLSGMTFDGITKTRRELYRYQEWFLKYT